MLTKSYVDVAYADAHFKDTFDEEAWEAADISLKTKALVTATKLIDMHSFVGVKLSPSQPLAFPRANTSITSMPDHLRIRHAEEIAEMTTIPLGIQRATCEQALYLVRCSADTDIGIQIKQYEQLRNANIESYSIDGASIKFNLEKGISPVSMIAEKLIEPYLKKYTRLI